MQSAVVRRRVVNEQDRLPLRCNATGLCVGNEDIKTTIGARWRDAARESGNATGHDKAEAGQTGQS